MMAVAKRGVLPFAPLVLDDAESLEPMAAAVMRLHSTLMTVGRCYTTDATGDRAALELGRVESVLAGAFCRIFGQSPADRFTDIFDQATTWPSTWSRITSSRTVTSAQALSFHCPS